MATRGETRLTITRQAVEPPAARSDATCHATGAGVAGADAGGCVRIAGRYRLDDQVGETGHCTVWKAFDELLGRPVTMRTFAPGFARGAEVVAAARAACQVRDERMERVFDAEEAAGSGYVVSEWPTGEHLGDILAAGPVDITWAARLIAQAARALAVAHAAGTAHLCLTPRSLRWSPDGGVKITGLGIDAALAERPPTERGSGGGPADPASADTRALARLLYAALTGYWPGPQQTPLPAAPRRDGRPYRPRQVRAGVPARIDEITCRALFGPVACGEQPVSSPGELAELLEAVLRDDAGHAAMAARADDVAAAPGWDAAVGNGRGWRRRRGRHALAGGLVGALFVIDSALIGISLMAAGNAPHVANTITRSPAPRHVVPRSQQPTRLLTPVSAQAFDPFGAGADENNQLASAAIDEDPDTAWHTFWYTTEHFGNLKPGTGLLLDMGRRVSVSRVRVVLGPMTGTDMQLRTGNQATSLDGFAVAATADDVGGPVSLRPASHHRFRYMLIWFTDLPPQGVGSGVFQANIYDVAVHGR